MAECGPFNRCPAGLSAHSTRACSQPPVCLHDNEHAGASSEGGSGLSAQLELQVYEAMSVIKGRPSRSSCCDGDPQEAAAKPTDGASRPPPPRGRGSCRPPSQTPIRSAPECPASHWQDFPVAPLLQPLEGTQKLGGGGCLQTDSTKEKMSSASVSAHPPLQETQAWGLLGR